MSCILETLDITSGHTLNRRGDTHFILPTNAFKFPSKEKCVCGISESDKWEIGFYIHLLNFL